MNDLQKELEVAKKAALAAGKVIAQFYGNALKVSHKSPEQPLTEADLQSNSIIHEMVSASFADYGWLSEEDVDDHTRLAKKRLWVVDPLDGTRDFINRNPEFAVSIALVEDKIPVVGVVYNPITKELFYASANQGSFCNGKKMSVKARIPTKKIQLIVSQSEYKRGEWHNFNTKYDIKPTGGCAYKMGKIARGDADGTFTLNPKSDWDICAGHIIIEEAGGLVRNLAGDTVTYNNETTRKNGLIYCSNSEVLEDILEALHNRAD